VSTCLLHHFCPWWLLSKELFEYFAYGFLKMKKKKGKKILLFKSPLILCPLRICFHHDGINFTGLPHKKTPQTRDMGVNKWKWTNSKHIFPYLSASESTFLTLIANVSHLPGHKLKKQGTQTTKYLIKALFLFFPKSQHSVKAGCWSTGQCLQSLPPCSYAWHSHSTKYSLQNKKKFHNISSVLK
jgi:hypothetical protein